MPFNPFDVSNVDNTFGKLNHFFRMGILTPDSDNIEKLPSGVKTEIKNRYQHIQQGIEVFNHLFTEAIGSAKAQEFKKTSRKLKETINERSPSLSDLRDAVGAHAAIQPKLDEFNSLLKLCDYYQRESTWVKCKEQISNNRQIASDQRALREEKLKFLQAQWNECVAYAHFNDQQLVDLIKHSEILKSALNAYLTMEPYFNSEAKFFFDDVRIVLEELEKQLKIISNAAYHRLRTSKKSQYNGYSDPVVELRHELKLLGVNIGKELNIDKNPRCDLENIYQPTNKKVSEELVNIVNEHGTPELRAKLSNLNTYNAYANDLSVPVLQYEENIFPLPGVVEINSRKFSVYRANEFNIDKSDLEFRKAPSKSWWNRWSRCQYDLFNHKDLRLFNALTSLIRNANVEYNEAQINGFVDLLKQGEPPANESWINTAKKALTNRKEANEWIKSNADRLLNLLNPPIVPNSWASFSWLKGTSSNKTHKLIDCYRRILHKAKKGTLQYPVPKGLEEFIPFERGEVGSLPRVRHDLFLGTTFISQFNELAFIIKDNFDGRYNELNNLKASNPLLNVCSHLRIKEITDIEYIIKKMETQIAENMPSALNPFNWFSTEADKTKKMLNEWKSKINIVKKDLNIKKVIIAEFISKNIERYIDESNVEDIDTSLIKILKDFVMLNGTEADKSKFKNATTLCGLFTKYLKEGYFLKMTSTEPKKPIAINLSNIARILALASKFLTIEELEKNEELRDVNIKERINALKSICDIIKGKSYPNKKKDLINKLKLLLGENADQSNIDIFINDILKPYWNPYEINADKFMLDLCNKNEAMLSAFNKSHNELNKDLHTLMLGFLDRYQLTPEDGGAVNQLNQNISVLHEDVDITSSSQKRYKIDETGKPYFPAQIYAYLARNNPKNVKLKPNCHGLAGWNDTFKYAREHAQQSKLEKALDRNDKCGLFDGENTYAAELISCIGDFQAISHYTQRLMLSHLKSEHSKPTTSSYNLDETERSLFLVRHKQATIMGYIKSINNYVSNVMFQGASFQFAELIAEICKKDHVESALVPDIRSDDDKRVIRDEADELRALAKDSIVTWGLKRFEFLILNSNYRQLSAQDNSFFHIFLSDEPELKAKLQMRIHKWLFEDKAFDGSHNSFWNIVSWLGNYSDESNKGKIINEYARLRLQYVFNNNLTLNEDDVDFIMYNKNVDGFQKAIAETLLKYLSGNNYTGQHYYYLNLVLWLSKRALESNDGDLKELSNKIIRRYITKRLGYLFDRNLPLVTEDWEFLTICKNIPDMTSTIKTLVLEYVNKYTGDNTVFIKLVLGFKQAYIGENNQYGFLYKEYSDTYNVSIYIVKRLCYVMRKGDPLSIDDDLISKLLDYVTDKNVDNNEIKQIEIIKNNIAVEINRFILKPKTNFWQPNSALKNETIECYTTLIRQLVKNPNGNRSIEQIELMKSYAAKRLLVLMVNNQDPGIEQSFFTDCCSEADVKHSISLLINHNISNIIAIDEFKYISLINKLNEETIALYYLKRFERLFQAKIDIFPLFDLNNIREALLINPLNASLNINLQALIKQYTHVAMKNHKDERLIQLLNIVTERDENKEFVADQIASMLDSYLTKQMDPPIFFRDFCINSKNESLQNKLDAVVRKHLQNDKLLAKWDPDHIEQYIIDHNTFNWYKTLMNYASDKTCDECFVPVLHSIIIKNDKAAYDTFRKRIELLAKDGNKPRNVPVLADGYQKLDHIIDKYVYINEKSKPWNEATCEIVEAGHCTDKAKDKYRCGELVRRLTVATGLSLKDYDAFFNIADKDWELSDKEPRFNFIKWHKDTLNQAINVCLTKEMPWHGNAQRILRNYADRILLNNYYSKWYLEQIESRRTNVEAYQSHKNENYSAFEDASNSRIYAESRLKNTYGSNLDTIAERTRDYLIQMRLDNIDALAIVESHFNNPAENSQHKQELVSYIERYRFVVITILDLWKINDYRKATDLLKQKAHAKIGIIAPSRMASSAENEVTAEEKALLESEWEASFLEKVKCCAEDYVKDILFTSAEINSSVKHVKLVAKSFLDSLLSDHPYNNPTEFLVAIRDGNKQMFEGINQSGKVFLKLKQIFTFAEKLKLSKNLLLCDKDNLLDVYSFENAYILTSNLSKKDLRQLINDLNKFAGLIGSSHPLSVASVSFVNLLNNPQEAKRLAEKPDNTHVLLLFAAAVAVNRQFDKYLVRDAKFKAVSNITAEQLAEFEVAKNDPIMSSYLSGLVDQLLADRGYLLKQIKDEFEADKWQREFILKFGSDEQKTHLLSIEYARTLFQQMDDFLCSRDQTAMINLVNTITKTKDVHALAKNLLAHNDINLPSYLNNILRHYLENQTASLFTGKATAEQERQIWPFIVALINEAGLSETLFGQIHFMVAKALVMLDLTLSSNITGENAGRYAELAKFSSQVISNFGTPHERQTAEIIVEQFIRAPSTPIISAARVKVAESLANDRQHIHIELSKVAQASASSVEEGSVSMAQSLNSEDKALFDIIAVVKEHNSSVISATVQSLFKISAIKAPDSQMELELQNVARWYATISNLPSTQQLSIVAQQQILDKCVTNHSVKEMFSSLLTPISEGGMDMGAGKMIQKNMHYHVQTMVSFYKLLDSMATLSSMILDGQNGSKIDDRYFIKNARNTLQLFNELIARFDLISGNINTKVNLQKQKDDYKVKLLAKYPNLFAPMNHAAQLSNNMLFAHSGSSTDSDRSSPTSVSSVDSSPASSVPATPRKGSFLSNDPCPLNPAESPNKAVTSLQRTGVKEPSLLRSSSLFSLLSPSKASVLSETDKNIDGLEKYITLRNTFLKKLVDGLKANSDHKAIRDAAARLTELNQNILTIVSVVNDTLGDSLISDESAIDSPQLKSKLITTQLSRLTDDEHEFMANLLDDMGSFGHAKNDICKEFSHLLKKAFEDIHYSEKRFGKTQQQSEQTAAVMPFVSNNVNVLGGKR
jgi:hypothetical protein